MNEKANRKTKTLYLNDEIPFSKNVGSYIADSEMFELEDCSFEEQANTEGIERILKSYSKATEKYPDIYLNIILDEILGMFFVMYCSDKNSFNVGNAICTDECVDITTLKKVLDSKGISYSGF